MSEQLKLWFFRDLTDEQRLKLFGLFSLPTDEIGTTHGRQAIALQYIMQSLIKMVATEATPAPEPISGVVRGTDAHASALEAFTAYFVRNYPGPDTIIHDPNWHAPKLFAAAVRAITEAKDAEAASIASQRIIEECDE